jgi:hypothetical protein
LILLLVVLIVAVVGGVIAFVIFQFSGVGTALPSAPRLDPGASRARVHGSLVQRLEDAPQGCLWGAIAAMGVWIALWAVVLILGLRVLLA